MNEEWNGELCFLGTGAGDANWGLESSNGRPEKDVRRYASLSVAPDALIDFNNHTSEAMDTFGIPRDSVRHLLISHGHYDHFQPEEIVSFAEGLPHPLKVYGNTMVRDAFEFCRGHVLDPETKRIVSEERVFNIEMNVLTPGKTARAGEAKVTAVLANHYMNLPYRIMEQQALNFSVECRGKALFYGLDSSCLLPGTVEMLSEFRFDAAILDATFGPLDIDPMRSGHLNWKMLDETISELREAGCITGNTVIVASHISTGNVEPYDEIATSLSKKGITLAYDGMKLVF